MSDRFIRHNITGCEAHRPRPIAYVRPGWPQRRVRTRRTGGRWPVLLWTAAMVCGVAAWGAYLTGLHL